MPTARPRRPLAFAMRGLLLAAALLSGPVLNLFAEEPEQPQPGATAGDAVILGSGAVLACELKSVTDDTVIARVGERDYTFERQELQGTVRAGVRLPRPAILRFVRDLAKHLASEDSGVREAAQKALASLGERGPAAVAEVGLTLKDPDQRKALGLPTPKPPLAPALRARIQEETKQARRTLDLKTEQEPGFEAALEAFIRSMASGGDPAAARKTLDLALAKVLTPEQLKKLRSR